MRLFDTHCHLNVAEYFPNPAEVIGRAADAGVERMVAIGIDLATSRSALELADRYPSVYASVGWHPNHAQEYRPGELTALRELLDHPKAVALGEIGLDYYWDFASPEIQFSALQDQFQLAVELDKPVVFHCRNAYPDLLEFLERQARRPKFVLHCFMGSKKQLKRATQLDAYIGVDGPVTYAKNDQYRDIVALAPVDRLLIETDSPYMTPEPHRGESNEPAYVKLVNEALAHMHQMAPERFSELSTRNAETFFGLVPDSA